MLRGALIWISGQQDSRGRGGGILSISVSKVPMAPAVQSWWEDDLHIVPGRRAFRKPYNIFSKSVC